MFYVKTISTISLHKLHILACLPPTSPVIYVGLHAFRIQFGLFVNIADVQSDCPLSFTFDTKIIPTAMATRVTIAP
jgi:hypothetical protein